MKIFGIGLNKTGTTTLGECFEVLGYNTKRGSDPQLLRHVEKNDLEPVFEVSDQFEAFEDWPWPLIYEELDQRYPSSKFILTVRSDPETWFRSLEKHAMQTGPKEDRRIAYGHENPFGNEESHIQTYMRHNSEVRNYFSGQGDRLLEVCWEAGDRWEKLCRFLDKDIPDQPFPHARESKPVYQIYRDYYVRQMKTYLDRVGDILRDPRRLNHVLKRKFRHWEGFH